MLPHDYIEGTLGFFFSKSVADPGFPVGEGVDLVGGGVDSQGSYVLKILYVKTKELGPLGGARAGRAPPRSANVNDLPV